MLINYGGTDATEGRRRLLAPAAAFKRSAELYFHVTGERRRRSARRTGGNLEQAQAHACGTLLAHERMQEPTRDCTLEM